MKLTIVPIICALVLTTTQTLAQESSSPTPKDWSVGAYAGPYYDTEPAGFLVGNANFKAHHMAALTASKTVWRSETLPMTLEWDAMIGQQFGVDNITEVAVAPVVSWNGFPWNHILKTSLRAGPLGLSYTSKVSPLERGKDDKGSRVLNFLMLEAAFSLPKQPEHEMFFRLHHRCTIYDLMNNYGANGQDFFAVGYRYRF